MNDTPARTTQETRSSPPRSAIMRCPRCGSTLRPTEAGDVTVDVCASGCGGLWFDAFELEKLDEPHEPAGDLLLVETTDEDGSGRGDVRSGVGDTGDAGDALPCPSCDAEGMNRHFWSTRHDVEVDECPVCGGFWLDAGELRRIRGLYDTDEERRAAAREYYDDLFGDELEELRERSEERVAKARKIAHMLRFVCPSYYIPGDQPWGPY